MQEYLDFIARNPLMSAAWVGLAGMLVYSTVRDMLSPVKTIGSQQATLLINKEEAQVIDIRAQDAFDKGHLPHALHLPLTHIQSGNFSPADKHKERPLIVVCEQGISAVTAARLCSKAGFSRVFVLQGGIVQWNSEHLPLTKKR